MNLKCFECSSEKNIHNHHVVPKILGGTKTIPLCAACHGKVHDRDILRMSNLSKMARKKEGFKTGRPKKILDDSTKTKKEKQFLIFENKARNLKEELEKIQRKEELIKLCFNDKSLSVTETCKELNISRATYYREIKKRIKIN